MEHIAYIKSTVTVILFFIFWTKLNDYSLTKYVFQKQTENTCTWKLTFTLLIWIEKNRILFQLADLF